MKEYRIQDLKVNPLFRDKIPPLTADEFKRLEENIVADGEVREPLIVWAGTVVDGHHRLSILKKHPDIPFSVREMDFADEWEAVAWMCANQLGRRNVTDEQKTYLLGKLYEARKKTQGSNNQYVQAKSEKAQNEPFHKENITAYRIAEEQGVGKETVKRAEHYAKGLDRAEEVVPGFRDEILTGSVKATKQDISALRKLDGDELKKAVDEIKRPEPTKPKRTYDTEYSKRMAKINDTIASLRDEKTNDVNPVDKMVEIIESMVNDFIENLRFAVSANEDAIGDQREYARTRIYEVCDNAVAKIKNYKKEIMK